MKFEVRHPESLSKHEIDELYELFLTAFQADRTGFEQDLSEKHRVLIVRDDKRLQAFTSLRVFRPQAGVRVFFSGDTFAAPEARVGHRLPSVWARYVFTELGSETSEDYWLLLCSGFRTYRILPTFFRSFCPSREGHPEFRELRDKWASEIFGSRFSQGVVKPRWATPLLHPEPPQRLLSDTDVRLFLDRNPGYREGDELVCLAPLAESNLTPAGLRLARRGVVVS